MTHTIRKITRLKYGILFRDIRETLQPMQMEHQGLTPLIKNPHENYIPDYVLTVPDARFRNI